MASHVIDVQIKVKIQMLKWIKIIKSTVQNVYHNSCYLIENKKHLLKNLNFVFRDMSLFLLWLLMSPYMKELEMADNM
jgi:hypothetical protein